MWWETGPDTRFQCWLESRSISSAYRNCVYNRVSFAYLTQVGVCWRGAADMQRQDPDPAGQIPSRIAHQQSRHDPHLRQLHPVIGSIPLPDRCYRFDADELLPIPFQSSPASISMERIYDLSNPRRVEKTIPIGCRSQRSSVNKSATFNTFSEDAAVSFDFGRPVEDPGVGLGGTNPTLQVTLHRSFHARSITSQTGAGLWNWLNWQVESRIVSTPLGAWRLSFFYGWQLRSNDQLQLQLHSIAWFDCTVRGTRLSAVHCSRVTGAVKLIQSIRSRATIPIAEFE